MAWETILKRGIGITKNAFAYALEFMQNSGMVGEEITSKQLYFRLRDALEALSQDSRSNQLKRGFMISSKASSNLESASPQKLIYFAIRELGVPEENKIELRSSFVASKKAQLFFKVPSKDEWKNPFR